MLFIGDFKKKFFILAKTASTFDGGGGFYVKS